VTEAWHALDSETVLERLSSSETGLAQTEAGSRLAQYGPNELAIVQKHSAIRMFLAQFTNILTIILLVAVFVSFGVGEFVDAALILAIVFASALLGFTQEYRAESALKALREMLRPTATVVRDGQPTEILSREIVPGDILLVKEGDRLPADGRVIDSVNLKISEAAITGESVPVQKSTSPLPDSTSLGDRRNMVFSGTDVSYGKGTIVIVATGLSTEFGKIAASVATVKKEMTPLERRTREIGSWLGSIALVVCIAIIAIGLLREFLLKGTITVDFALGMVLFGIALAVAAVPEALPGVVTGSLAIGMRRMAKEQALVRRMAAVETLGCTSVICSDKTGTITRGEMTVREIRFSDASLAVMGEGYVPKGEIKPIDGDPALMSQERLRILLEGCVLCNDAELVQTEGRWRILGDPTEGALIVLAAKAGIDAKHLRSTSPRIGEIPFSSDRKRMTTIHDGPGEAKRIYMKGACEIVLERCTHFAGRNGAEQMTSTFREHLLQKNAEMAARALRVLAVSYCDTENVNVTDEDAVENGLTFVGLVGMIDPSRSEAIRAIEICKSVGIKPIMITGDHKLTAVAIAGEVGIHEPDDAVLTDKEMESMGEPEFHNLVDKVTVYARVSPSTKLRIVRAWKERGEVVAMTGDGVNDAPALKQADIGVAMGITGTDVTKEASDLVLADDNFATIEKAIELGRWIYDNIKKYLAYLLRANLVEIIVLSAAVLLGYAQPLTPAQILYINLVTDGLPAIALGLSPPDPDIMQRPPRDPKESIFSKDVKQFILITVLIQVPLFLLIYTSIAPIGVTADNPALTDARTVLFYLFVFCELTLALTCRSLKHAIWESPPHKLLIASVIFSIVLTVVLFGVVPGVAEAFGIAPLGLAGIEIVVGLCILTLLSIEGLKVFIRRRESKFTGGIGAAAGSLQ